MKQVSEFFSLNVKDLVKGFAVAIIFSVLKSLYEVFEAGGWPATEQLLNALKLGLGAGIAYLLKNLFTNSDDELLKRENARVEATKRNSARFKSERA